MVAAQQASLKQGPKPSYMSSEQFQRSLQRGLQYGSGDAQADTRIFPRGYRFLSSDIPAAGLAFLVSGPFGPVMAMYMRNETDGTYGVYMDDPAHPVTIGPEDQRRLEFDTPTDSDGRVSSMRLVIVPLTEPTVPETIFVEIE